jgi:hypothetical protein
MTLSVRYIGGTQWRFDPGQERMKRKPPKVSGKIKEILHFVQDDRHLLKVWGEGSRGDLKKIFSFKKNSIKSPLLPSL